MLWDFVDGQYDWSWSWMGVAIGLVGGLVLVLMFTGGGDIVLTIPFVISYGSFLGVLFNCMGLFSSGGAFISAGLGVLIGSGAGLAGDADDGRDRSDEGWVLSVFMGVGFGVMIGTLTGISTAALAFLAFIFDWDFRALFNAFWPSFVAGSISGAATFYLVHFRLLYYPIELFISLLAFLKSTGSKQSVIKAWHIHPISWNEVSRLPLPFSRSLLIHLANFDREAGLRQVNVITERRFHVRTARQVLETITLNDLQAKTIEEIADIGNKLSWAPQIPSQTNQDLIDFLQQFEQVSAQTAQYLVLQDRSNVEDLRGVLQKIQELLTNIYGSKYKVATKFGPIARNWRDVLALEERKFCVK
jgi:hypothetical protein